MWSQCKWGGFQETNSFEDSLEKQPKSNGWVFKRILCQGSLVCSKGEKNKSCSKIVLGETKSNHQSPIQTYLYWWADELERTCWIWNKWF